MGDLKVYLFSTVSRAAAAAAKGGGERGEFSLQRSISKGKLIFGEPMQGEGRWRNRNLVL